VSVCRRRRRRLGVHSHTHTKAIVQLQVQVDSGTLSLAGADRTRPGSPCRLRVGVTGLRHWQRVLLSTTPSLLPPMPGCSDEDGTSSDPLTTSPMPSSAHRRRRRWDGPGHGTSFNRLMWPDCQQHTRGLVQRQLGRRRNEGVPQNDPLRGTKGDSYEGGCANQPASAGPACCPPERPATNMWVGDVFPTTRPTGVTPQNTKPFDGVNLACSSPASSNVVCG